MKKQVLGVNIDDINLEEALKRVEGFLKDGKKHYIVTPNPEILVAASKDKVLKEILNNADLSIPDGIGLKLGGVKNTFAGVDFMEAIIKESNDKGYTIGLLGGGRGVAAKVKECLEQRYQNISVPFADSGGKVNEKGESESIKLPNLDILFVGFGHGKQEKWISKNINSTNVKVFMVVGGTLDYLSGQVLRAPKVLRDLGLEWLFRLIIQPWRIKRQLSLLEYLLLLTRG